MSVLKLAHFLATRAVLCSGLSELSQSSVVLTFQVANMS